MITSKQMGIIRDYASRALDIAEEPEEAMENLLCEMKHELENCKDEVSPEEKRRRALYRMEDVAFQINFETRRCLLLSEVDYDEVASLRKAHNWQNSTEFIFQYGVGIGMKRVIQNREEFEALRDRFIQNYGNVVVSINPYLKQCIQYEDIIFHEEECAYSDAVSKTFALEQAAGRSFD